MKTRPNLNDNQLAISVAQEYRLHDVMVTFVPVGQDAYAYRVSSFDGTHHLKVYRHPLKWDAPLKVPALLKHDFGVKGAVAPIETVSGAYSFIIAGYPAALFPFIDAPSMATYAFTFDQLHETGRFLAILHGLTPQLMQRGIKIDREQFDIPHSERFQRVMNAVKAGARSDNPYQAQLVDMLKPLEKRLWVEHEDYARSAEAAKAEGAPLVVCHGDPTGGNILGGHSVSFIDWDNVILAPKERDLIFFEGDPNKAAALSSYGYVSLNPVIMRYYRLMWNIQEVADFGCNILFTEYSSARQAAAQNAADLAEMKQFLQYSGLGKR